MNQSSCLSIRSSHSFLEMLRLILVSVFLTATRIIAAAESNSTTNSIFATPPPMIGTPAVDNSDQPNDSSCSSRGKKDDSCVSIFRCADFSALYQKPVRTSSENNLLLNSFCGWASGAPYVCCQNSNKSAPIVKNKPAVTNSTSMTELICGRTILETRNGYAVASNLGAWPWMAALYARSNTTGITSFRCGASLIAKEWVLTAAHCIPESRNVTLSHVRLGDWDLDDSVEDNLAPVNTKIKQVIKHAQYSKKPVTNDIALLRLSSPVEYTDYIRPICLYTAKKYLNDTYYDRKRPFIAGWDTVGYPGKKSTPLLEAEIKVVPHSSCTSSYDRFIKAKQIKIDKSVICAETPLKDTCQGDSGGPLMFIENQTWFQGGVVSVGYVCANEEYPGVYTKVAAFADWIREKTGLNYL